MINDREFYEAVGMLVTAQDKVREIEMRHRKPRYEPAGNDYAGAPLKRKVAI